MTMPARLKSHLDRAKISYSQISNALTYSAQDAANFHYTRDASRYSDSLLSFVFSMARKCGSKTSAMPMVSLSALPSPSLTKNASHPPRKLIRNGG
jgi:hypothetical protein